MQQSEFRMPASGENWRHYKGGLYKIVGMALDDEGYSTVVYTEAGWTLAQLPPLFVQRVGRFLQEIEIGKPRFSFSSEANMLGCRFLNPVIIG